MSLVDALGIAKVLDKIPKRLRTVPVPERSKPSTKSDNTEQRSLSPPFEVSEYHITDKDKRLHGRPDHLSVDRKNHAIITELKTGKIFNKDDVPQETYRRQLEAYGYLVIESGLATSASLRLVGPNDSWVTDMTTEAHERIDSQLRRLLRKVPAHQSLSATTLATVGQPCRFCSYRPICPLYRTEAPNLWQSDVEFRLPFDVWGTITKITSGHDFGKVVIRDPNNRLVSVLGIPVRHLDKMTVDDQVSFYNIRPLRRTGQSYPNNFAIFMDRPEEAAHSAFITVDNE